MPRTTWTFPLKSKLNGCFGVFLIFLDLEIFMERGDEIK